nr:MAG: hypothetical protein DIU56_14555 [Pseudomonadota bacterium]
MLPSAGWRYRMLRLLAVFWLQRFVGVLALVSLGLLALEYAQQGRILGLASALAWGTAAAVLAASISTYWVYRVRCRTVLKQDGTELSHRD